MHRFAILVLIATTLVLPAATYDEALHPDGSLHYKIKLDREGRRHGPYVLHHPAGKAGAKGPKAEIGSYRNGEWHGVITVLDPTGEVLSESQWVAGTCMLPMTERFLDHRLKQIEAAATAAVAALPTDDPRPRPDAKTLADVLIRLNHYRLLCGVDHDVVLNADLTHEALCAAEVCAAMGRLDHHPKQNPGLSEERWQAGKKGCAKSNLAVSRTGPGAIDAWMDDSDPSNRDRVGHRRWLLWPELDRYGHGSHNGYAAGHVVDGKGISLVDVPAVRFPPHGLMPLAMFGSHYCWHVSPDPKRYEITKAAKLSIHPYDPKSGAIGPAIALQFENVDSTNLGGRSAIIAQPDKLALSAGAMYRVQVTGVTKKNADAPDLDWVTVFY